MSLTPHIHSGASIATIHWKKSAILLPLLGVCLWQSGFIALGIFAASLAGGIAGEIFSEILQQKKIKLIDGSTVLNSFVFAFLMPPSVPFWIAATGAFLAIVLGREIFGGFGSGIFHPALVGRIILGICFPVFFHSQEVLFHSDWLAILAVFLGGFFLFSQKLISWEIPIFYLGVIGIVSIPFGRESWGSLFSAGVLFSAFFLLSDFIAIPFSKRGRRFYAGIAGLLVCVFWNSTTPAPFVCAILIASILTPWLDRTFRQGSVL